MTREQARAARERCERATAGPWEHDPLQGEGTVVLAGKLYMVCDAGTANDGEFIAHARQDCPDALDMLERAMAIIETWNAQVWQVAADDPDGYHDACVVARDLAREWRGEARG